MRKYTVKTLPLRTMKRSTTTLIRCFLVPRKQRFNFPKESFCKGAWRLLTTREHAHKMWPPKSTKCHLHIKQVINCEKKLPVNLILILKGILFCDVCGGGRGGGGIHV